MSDTWYREPFELPPYVDDLGGVWSFEGERIGGPEPEPIEWPEGWPEDLHDVLFQIVFTVELFDRYHEVMDREIGRLVEGNGEGRLKGFLGP